ncbi:MULTISPECIES: hypothetical protein [unclassified Mesorhizobium]|uniref:hypothetical protein n=1 Tax=unclassified Mesorhizobium TaxID=325217 RepID=UPI00041D20FC|nr:MULTISPECIES: hypothetical protein [unclassified Mesorhizobium]WJI74985.1 hypothetical protein NLY37_29640 [Mesorhizobium sp. C395A]
MTPHRDLLRPIVQVHFTDTPRYAGTASRIAKPLSQPDRVITDGLVDGEKPPNEHRTF